MHEEWELHDFIRILEEIRDLRGAAIDWKKNNVIADMMLSACKNS
jgi:hypothetical protein